MERGTLARPGVAVETVWNGRRRCALRGAIRDGDDVAIRDHLDDSPALFYAGDRTLFALAHPATPGALDFLAQNEPAGFVPDFARHPDWNDPVHYPVVVDLLCAVTSYVFHDRMGVLDRVDGHHVGLVLLYALTLGAYAFYASALLGRLAGGAATVALALYPSAMGHSFNNAKDWPCSMFYALTVLAFALAVVRRHKRGLWIAGLWLGLALSAKINGGFALVTLAPWWTATYAFLSTKHERAAQRRLLGPAAVVPLIGFATFVILWPWLYQGGLLGIGPRVLRYVRHFLAQGVTQRPYWWAYSFRCVLWMTPVVTLIAAGTYALSGWAAPRRRASRWLLLVLWTMVPLLRIAMPHVNVYDGNRHFIEYVPALCAMAGAGVATTIQRLGAALRRHLPRLQGAMVAAVATTAVLASLIWPIARYYPFEVTYCNAFAGGLGNAQRLGLSRAPLDKEWPEWVTAGSEGDYWFTSLRDALRDVMTLRGPDAIVSACGPLPPQVLPNTPAGSTFTVVPWGDPSATVLYVSPRETICSLADHPLSRSDPPHPEAGRARRRADL